MTDDKIRFWRRAPMRFLREMIGFAAQRLMELESEALYGAGHGERSAAQPAQRLPRSGARGPSSTPC
jgi:hypothetical protein